MTTLCLRNCSQGFFPDANSVCVACPIGCLNCNSTMCMNPAPGYAIDLTATPVALIQMTSTYNMVGKLMNPDKTITACDVSCRTCIGDKMRCTSCPPTNYLFNSMTTCVSTCPQGTWIFAGNTTSPAACIPCQNNLMQCLNTTGLADPAAPSTLCPQQCYGCNADFSCIYCAQGMIKFPDKSCQPNTKPCPGGTILMNGVCQQCPQGAINCTMGMVDNQTSIIATQCDSLSGMFLYNGRCMNSPIKGLYMDQQVGWYLPCDCKCQSCQGNSKRCSECGAGLVLFNGTCIPQVVMDGAWMSQDMSSLTLSFNKPLMFYNKAKAAPAPSGVMCFNDNEGDLCQMDWNNLPPTQVQTNLD